MAFWMLLPGLTSLSAVSVATALIGAKVAPMARQVNTRVRGSLPLPPTVPRLQRTWVALVGTQMGLAGTAETKLAPTGTEKVNTVLVAASTALLSTTSV